MYKKDITGEDYAMFALAIFLLTAQTLIDSWVVGWFWYWFAVSMFGLPAMTYLTTVGILIGLRFAINGFGEDGRTESTDLSKEVLLMRIVFVPIFLWLVGFVLFLFA